MQPERSQREHDVRSSSALTIASSAQPTLYLSEWPFDPTIAMLVQADHTIEIDLNHLIDLINRASALGVRKIRTGALRATSAARVLSQGFHVIDTLALLSRDLSTPIRRPSVTLRTRRLRRRHIAAAESVDLDAFGPKWAQHRDALRDTGQATLHSRSRRVASDNQRVIGFALSGYTNDVGYLQRLAISPDHQGRGIGSVLAYDALQWMQRRGCDHALVNTSLRNERALGLYERIGFSELAEKLTIAELDVERRSL